MSVNSNYCARLNPWVLYDPVDPGQQLQWLRDQLVSAERDNQMVHIIGHVPPDHRECTEAWLYNYIRIIERFRDIIKAQFFGHTHRDEFRVMYSLKNPEDAVGLQFISPSITSYSQTNPGYRVYHVRSSDFSIKDYDTYFFNLTASNRGSPSNTFLLPVWTLEYKASDAYGFKTASSREFHKILKGLDKDPIQFENYHRRYFVQSEVDIAKVWDLMRRDIILNDHEVRNPFIKTPASLIPVS